MNARPMYIEPISQPVSFHCATRMVSIPQDVRQCGELLPELGYNSFIGRIDLFQFTESGRFVDDPLFDFANRKRSDTIGDL